ncbi:hypothetical protein Peur_031890 [Populus x canadensis]
MTTAFQEGGLQNRSGSFLHKDHLGKSNVPALATAGDQDLICPPEASALDCPEQLKMVEIPPQQICLPWYICPRISIYLPPMVPLPKDFYLPPMVPLPQDFFLHGQQVMVHGSPPIRY